MTEIPVRVFHWKVIVLLISCMLAGCAIKRLQGIESTHVRFSKDLIQLKEYFHIPGMAVIITKGDQTLYEAFVGLANVENKIIVDSATTFPIASLTKIFSGILLMQLVEQQKLSLEEPINKYVTYKNIPDSIKIKHVLSHTSQGNVGQHFYYSGRFTWLTSVIEKLYGAPFDDVLEEQIFIPLGLSHTFCLKDPEDAAKAGRKIALGYLFENGIQDGFITNNLSASAGIISTVRDLSTLSKAIDNNQLMTEESKQKMFTPFAHTLPYGYGVFAQEFEGMQMIWAYGQYDCYSSLFLKIPERDLTVIMTANNALMSDPARLIYGDVTSSLFALSFLKNYVLDLEDVPILENENSLSTLDSRISKDNASFYLKKLLAQSVAESYLLLYDSTKRDESKNIMERVYTLFPDYIEYGDLTLLHNLYALKNIPFQRSQVNFTHFDKQYEEIGFRLLSVDDNNPYANFYLANYYLINNEPGKTRVYYQKIVDASNYSGNWYTSVAEEWLRIYKP